MNKISRSKIKLSNCFNTLLLLLLVINVNSLSAQCDPNNKYDKVVSGYHSTVALLSGNLGYDIWGQSMAPAGNVNQLSPTPINTTNYPTLSGTVLKATIGGTSGGSPDQAVVLTTNGLYAWGIEGVVVNNSYTASSAVTLLTTITGSNTYGLPTGVTPTDVSILFSTFQSVVIVTKIVNGVGGNVYVLTQTSLALEGNGGAVATVGTSQWKQVKTNASTFLTNVVMARGQVSSVTYNALIAQTASGQLYTWGNSAYLGNASTSSALNYATLMTLPQEASVNISPKMIGITGGISTSGGIAATKNTYYVLSSTGNLYSLGYNNQKQLGDFTAVTTLEKTSWTQVKKSAAANDYLTGVSTFSCQESTNGFPGCAAVTEGGLLYTWGNNASGLLGRSDTAHAGDFSTTCSSCTFTSTGYVDPGLTADATGFIVNAELGGHTLMYLKAGTDQFCYVGHYTNGSMGNGLSGNNGTSGATTLLLDCSQTPNLPICGYVPVLASTTNSLISALPTSILANGTSTSTITVTLKDVNGNLLTNSGGNVNITTTAGTITNIIDNNDGTYTATLTSSSTVETATISYTINAAAGTNTATVNFTAVTPVASPITSTISANPSSILANGTSTSTITVQLKDASGTNFTTSGGTVVITTSAGTITNITDNNDGTYTATLTSSSTVETATISYTINAAAGTNTATVNFTAIPSGATPTITTSGTLTAMSACLGSESAAQSFTVSGIDLTSDIVVTAPTGFEISLSSGTGYAPTLSLATADGEVASTIIYVRLTSSASGSPSGNITVASTGVTTQNIAVSGSVNSIPSVSIDETNTNICQGGSVTLNAVSNGASQIYGSAYGTTSTGPGLDQNWDVVALPQTFLASSNYANLGVTIPYPAKVIYSGLPGIFVYGNGFVEGSNTYYWIAPYPAGTSLQNGSYNWIVRQEFQVTETGTYDFNFTGAGDNDISFFIDGTIDTSSPELPTITGGTQIGATHNTFTSIGTMTGSVALTPGTHYAYMVMQDYGGLTCALISGAEVTGQNTFTWSKKAASASTFTTIPGATNANFTPTNITETTTFKVEINNGSCTNTSEVTVNVDPTSVAGSISGAATVCEGTNSTTLTLSGNTGTIQWQSSTDNSTFTNISGATGQTYTATNLTATTYYQAVVTSGVCASATTTSVTITVSPLPSAVVGADATICSGSTFTENGTAANGTIIWITSGTGTYSDATIANPVYTPSAADISAGSVILSMIVKGENGCYTVNDSIYTYASHTLNIVSVLVPTVDAGAASDSICSDTVFYASGTATNGTILWTTSGSGSFSDATIASPIYTPSAADITAGTVTLTMTVTSSGVGSCPANAPVSDTVILTIATPPTADAGSTTDEICAGSNYTLSGTAAHGSILWTTSGNGTFSDATIASPVYTPSVDDIANGSVGLTLTVTGTGGCSVTSDVIQLTFIAAPTVDAGPATDTICSDSTYTTSATATVGAQLVWSTSGTGTFTNGTTLDAEYTPSTADITAGTVTLTLSVTGSGVCSSVAVTDTIILTISPAPTSNAGPSTDSICIGSTYTPSGTATNGTILWTTTGTGTFNNVSIATPVYTPSASDIASGSVSLTMTVTGSGSCAAATVSDTVVLTISASPSANAGPATAHICAGANYTLAGTSTNGTVLWTTSGTGTFNNASSNTPVYTPSVADITAGTVTLTMTVTGSAGCSSATASDTLVLTIFKVTNTTSQINIACNGGSNGSASVTPTGGTAPYTYAWSPSGGSLYSAINLTAGTYTCLVTDANGCTATSSFTITQPTAITGTISQTNVTTFAGVDGSASVSVSGGTTPYTYSWSPFGGSSSTASNLTAGTYTCTITDANGCSITRTATLTQPSAFTATISQTNILCNGLSTGTATVSVTGGVAPINYSWSPSGGTGATASNLSAGTYICTITDGTGATLTRTATITQPSALTATTSQTNVAINGNASGSATVIATGGTTPYTYSWSPSVGSTATVSNLIAGLYTCIVTDTNGCTVTKSITISQPAALVSSASQTNVNCFGASTGSATLSVTGGVVPYVYSWSPSVSTGATANNLAAGTYTCTATDANGAVQTYTFTITQPTLLVATTSQTNVLCNGATTGSATVTVSGGTSGYTYSWSPSGGTSATANNLGAGSYTCTITDANGCILTKSFTITEPTVLSATVIQTNVTVFGASTGSAGVVVSGGALPYTYSWSPSGGTGASAINLAAGTYVCTITDANGCTLTKTFTITQPSSLVATTSQTNILCNGAATGSASVSVSGGSSTYSYLWSPTGGTSATATNLVAGVYTCSITDSNGALLVKTFTITQPNLLAGTTSQTNVSINGASTGAATVTVTGGVAPITYSWSPTGGTSATASNLAAGAYTCTVTDANGCSITKNYIITEPTALTATTSQTNVLCNGATTGAASVSVSGGVSPYTYSWNPSVGSGASLNGLTAGTYVCTITDANGAVITRTITITEPTALTATTTQTNVTCNSGSNATASVVVSGGTSGYTYSWSPSGGTGATASNLVAGAYTCTITDANGCTLTKTFTITQPTALTAATTQTNVSINGGSTGAASVSVSGGTSGYTYSWSPSGGTSATASNLAAGTYTCTVTDANGCTVTNTFTITEPTALTATTTQTNVLCNGATTGVASVVANGAVGPYTYSWSPSGGTSATASNLAAGTYVCTITDANGAVIIKTVTITQSPLIANPIANAGPATDGICAGFAYTSTGSATNGSILWTTSGSGTFADATIANAVYNPSAADIATGTVQLTMTVIAPGTCNVPTATDSVVVTIYPTSNAGLISGATSVCQGVNSTTLTLSEYTGTIQWQVSTDNIVFNNIPSATTPTYTVTNLVATTYYRAIVTSGVCSSATTATATINVSTTSVAGTISGAAPVCYGTNSTTLTLTGNVGTIQWQSSTDNINFTTIVGATTSTYTASNLTVTTYYRTVSTSGVCSAATTATTVVVNPLPVSNAGPVTASICAGTTYTTSGVSTNGTALWSTSGTGTFADATNPVTTYTPSSADQTNGSVVLTMLVTGSASGCTLNTATDAIILAINSPVAPSANANQNYCYLNNPTVANLVTTSATNVQWYAVPTGGVALSTSTPLVTGTTYYATQTVSGCESITRTAVSIILTCSVNAVVDNLAPINGYFGGTTTSVLSNDLMNGSTLVPSNVILTGTSVPTGFTFNANGTVTIPAGTPAGNYQLTYSICELLNPSNCSQTIATVVVSPAVIDAVVDNYGMINGFIGSVTNSVLENDLLNGVLVIPSEITLSVVTIPSGLIFNANGTITILPGTAPGIYVVNYLISENLNPNNTDQASAIVTVVDCLAYPVNDCDGDGVTNGQEIIDGTNPSDSCSMVYTHQTVATTSAWNNLDCDGDGVINGQEIIDGTNPTDLCSLVLASQSSTTSANWNNSDCDGDGVRNAQEILDGTNLLDLCSFNSIHITATTSTTWNNLDCDGDGVTNGQEILDGTNPSDSCSLNYIHIVVAPSSAWNNLDCDGDGVTNGQEILDGTNPTVSCSFNPANQTVPTSTTWNNIDCDGDGVINGQEITDGTNPFDLCSLNPIHQTVATSTTWNNSDCDGDGVTNNQEVIDNTDLLDSCSFILNHQSVAPSTAWLSTDCDGDGVTNGQEITDGTDLNDSCDSNSIHVSLPQSQLFLSGDCDGDGLSNGEEIGSNPTAPNDFDNDNIPDYLEYNNHTATEDDLEIFNAVTPNGNADNDVFVIRNIQLYPNNTLTIFNRWGVVVYEVDSYGQDNKFFKGISEGRTTLRQLEELPIGTYFYTLRYVNSQGVQKTRSGYLYLNK